MTKDCKEVFTDIYAPNFEAGTLTWKARPLDHFKRVQDWKTWNILHAGKLAGSTRDDGYRRVDVNNKGYLLHRVLFEMANGPIPDGFEIDHIDGNPANNSLGNLRVATRVQNSQNSRRKTSNTSGYPGVDWSKGAWRARIRVNGKRIDLGRFGTKWGAYAAYKEVARAEHGEFMLQSTAR